MSKKQQTVDTYNATADRMAEKFNAIGARVEDINRTLSYVHSDNPNVLEIGCGNGREAKEIAKRATNYLGIDISEGMINVAREYAPECIFKVADVEQFEFPKNLDAIFSFASLLHSPKDQVETIVSKAYSSLREGGVFFISLKHAEYKEETKSDEFGTRTYYFYTPELIIELAGSKFKVVYQHIHDLRGQRWFEIILQK